MSLSELDRQSMSADLLMGLHCFKEKFGEISQ